jgi:hypothetical protein
MATRPSSSELTSSSHGASSPSAPPPPLAPPGCPAGAWAPATLAWACRGVSWKGVVGARRFNYVVGVGGCWWLWWLCCWLCCWLCWWWGGPGPPRQPQLQQRPTCPQPPSQPATPTSSARTRLSPPPQGFVFHFGLPGFHPSLVLANLNSIVILPEAHRGHFFAGAAPPHPRSVVSIQPCVSLEGPLCNAFKVCIRAIPGRLFA